ncbi:hypothetical protein RCL1_006343 [Eukaryota sp. TZLM3-RCL]
MEKIWMDTAPHVVPRFSLGRFSPPRTLPIPSKPSHLPSPIPSLSLSPSQPLSPQIKQKPIPKIKFNTVPYIPRSDFSTSSHKCLHSSASAILSPLPETSLKSAQIRANKILSLAPCSVLFGSKRANKPLKTTIVSDNQSSSSVFLSSHSPSPQSSLDLSEQSFLPLSDESTQTLPLTPLDYLISSNKKVKELTCFIKKRCRNLRRSIWLTRISVGKEDKEWGETAKSVQKLLIIKRQQRLVIDLFSGKVAQSRFQLSVVAQCELLRRELLMRKYFEIFTNLVKNFVDFRCEGVQFFGQKFYLHQWRANLFYSQGLEISLQSLISRKNQVLQSKAIDCWKNELYLISKFNQLTPSNSRCRQSLLPTFPINQSLIINRSNLIDFFSIQSSIFPKTCYSCENQASSSIKRKFLSNFWVKWRNYCGLIQLSDLNADYLSMLTAFRQIKQSLLIISDLNDWSCHFLKSRRLSSTFDCWRRAHSCSINRMRSSVDYKLAHSVIVDWLTQSKTRIGIRKVELRRIIPFFSQWRLHYLNQSTITTVSIILNRHRLENSFEIWQNSFENRKLLNISFNHWQKSFDVLYVEKLRKQSKLMKSAVKYDNLLTRKKFLSKWLRHSMAIIYDRLADEQFRENLTHHYLSKWKVAVNQIHVIKVKNEMADDFYLKLLAKYSQLAFLPDHVSLDRGQNFVQNFPELAPFIKETRTFRSLQLISLFFSFFRMYVVEKRALFMALERHLYKTKKYYFRNWKSSFLLSNHVKRVQRDCKMGVKSSWDGSGRSCFFKPREERGSEMVVGNGLVENNFRIFPFSTSNASFAELERQRKLVESMLS